MNKHTKGPWSYKPAMTKSANDEIFSGNYVIAIIKNHLNPANAHLIASAPELLEALEGLLSVVEQYDLPLSDPERINAHAAIARAKGETK